MNKTMTIMAIAFGCVSLFGCKHFKDGDTARAHQPTYRQYGNKTRATADTSTASMEGEINGMMNTRLDDRDRQQFGKILEGTKTGKSRSWKNIKTGVVYTVEPTQTYKQAGKPCRNYTTKAKVEGETQIITGSACRGKNGDWYSS